MKMYNMQALHRKIDVVLVQILRYNCSETDYSCCEDLPPSRTPPSTRMWVSPSDPFTPLPLLRGKIIRTVLCCVVYDSCVSAATPVKHDSSTKINIDVDCRLQYSIMG